MQFSRVAGKRGAFLQQRYAIAQATDIRSGHWYQFGLSWGGDRVASRTENRYFNRERSLQHPISSTIDHKY